MLVVWARDDYMADILQKLFGSAARVKLLRLFLFNPRSLFTIEDLHMRARIKPQEARDEVVLLRSIGLLERSARGKIVRYVVNDEFPYLLVLRNLLLNTPARGKEIYNRLHGVGALKLIVIGGIFLGEWDSPIDLLVVGDRMSVSRLHNKVKILESEIGKELRFAHLSSEEFFYRLNMSDHLVRDVFDYPHQIVLDRLDIGLK